MLSYFQLNLPSSRGLEFELCRINYKLGYRLQNYHKYVYKSRKNLNNHMDRKIVKILNNIQKKKKGDLNKSKIFNQCKHTSNVFKLQLTITSWAVYPVYPKSDILSYRTRSW